MQLGHAVEVALALEFLDLALDAFDLFLHIRGALGLRLFDLPDFLQVGSLALELGDLVLDQGHALHGSLVLLLAHRLALDLQLDQPAVEPVHGLGLGVDLDLDLGRGLVDEVDRLVGQESVGDVAVGKLGRGDDCRVGDLHAVVHLVFLLQAAQDGHRGLDTRFVDQHLLEAPLQRGVLLHVFAVFVQRGGADAVQFAARQRGLEHVAGVDGAFGLAGADHGVQFVDEQDDAALVGSHFLEHGLEPLLELAAVFGAGQQPGHVEHQHTLVLQALGYLAVDDALRQPFDDGRLAHAGLADEDGIVLAAPLQHLDGAADLVVTADHGVELALARALGEVERIFLQRLALAFGLGVVDLLAAAHRVHRRFERLAREAVAAHDAADVVLGVGQRQQEHLAADELVAALGGFLVGRLQQLHQVAPGLHRLAPALHLGQVADRGFHGRDQRAGIGAGAVEQGPRPVGLLQHGGQQVRRLDIRVVAGDRQALGVAQCLLESGRELVLAHG